MPIPPSPPTQQGGQPVQVDGDRWKNLMEKAEINVGKLETQLNQWGAKLDELVAKADRAGTTARIDNRERIDDLMANVQAAQSKLDEVTTAGSEKWETLRTGVESAWAELELAVKKPRN
jgi:predicted  nucleic acid-binding Zn-ribbon protein